MSLSSPRTNYGLHIMTAVNRTTGEPYGAIKVLASANAALNRDAVQLYGGSNPSPWDSSEGNIDASLSITVKEFHKMLYQLAGYTKTEVAAESAGAVGYFNTTTKAVVWSESTSVLQNKTGTTVYNATTGIATVGLKSGSSADLKDGVYLIKAASATTVDVYAFIDNEFTEGTDVDYTTDLLKIVAGLTVTQSSATEITGTGVEFTGGSGTIALTTSDTAMFYVKSINSGSNEYVYGSNPVPVEFELYLTTQNKGNGEFVIDHYPRVKLSSIPATMTEKEWHEAELPMTILYDSTYGYSYKRVDTIK